MMAFLVGFFLPWLPYFFNIFKTPSNMNHLPRHDTFGFMFDHVTHSLYNTELINSHNAWYLLVNYLKNPTKAHSFFVKLQVPLVLTLSWSIFVNLLIILMTRGNNKISSHKKHLLQFTLIMLFNYTFGSPKLQSQEGLLALICSLLLILYSEYTIFAVLLAAAAHLTYLTPDQYLSSSLSFLSYGLVLAFHALFASLALRQFLSFCMAK